MVEPTEQQPTQEEGIHKSLGPIFGTIERSSSPLFYRGKNGERITVPEGAKWFHGHFMIQVNGKHTTEPPRDELSDEGRITKLDLDQRVVGMNIAEHGKQFLQALKADPDFRDVQYIMGNTNGPNGAFFIKHFGFHPASSDEDRIPTYADVRKNRSFASSTIVIPVNELMENAEGEAKKLEDALKRWGKRHHSFRNLWGLLASKRNKT